MVIAILLPAVFDLTERIKAPRANISLMDEWLSLGVSAVLLLLYAANLVYTLVTHRDVFASNAPPGVAEWNVPRAVAVMAAGTAVIAIEAELVSAALAATGRRRAGVGWHRGRPLCCGDVRAPGQDGHRVQHVHRLGDSDRPRGDTSARAGRMGDRPAVLG